MSNEFGKNGGIATCGISISADRTQVSIYLGGAENGDTFEFTMPKDLALHVANTIQAGKPRCEGLPKGHMTT